MIEVVELGKPADRWALLEKFDPLTQTWIVPDLKAKQYLQKYLSQKFTCFPEESVLRASEFWRKLFARSNPEFRFISPDLAETMAAHWFEERDEWVRTPTAARTALFYMNQLIPVFSYSQGPQSLVEWFKANPEAEQRWSHWFVEAYYLWSRFQKEKMISAGWSSGMLLQLIDTEHFSRELAHSERDIFVDLGVHVQPAEIELFARFSKISPIHLLRPNPDWASEYHKMFHAYQFMELHGATIKPHVPAAKKPPQVIYKKMTTQLAETKEAVAQVREWIDQKISPDKIAILASDLRNYWQPLSWYLKEEGVPFSQNTRVSVASFIDVMSWLALMRVHMGSWRSADLQASLFGSNSPDLISFERFQHLYEMIYDNEDLSRSDVVAKFMESQKADSNTIFSRDDFVKWTLFRWKSNQTERLAKILQRFLQDAPVDLSFKLSVWHKYLERVIQRSEVEVEEPSLSGVICSELHSAEHLDYTHAVILGLNESALKKTSKLGIVFRDIYDIEKSLGFNLPDAEDRKLEFELRWIFEDQKNYLALNSVSDFEGRIESASTLWIQGAHKQGVKLDQVLPPRETRWDTIHAASKDQWHELRGWNKKHGEKLQQSLKTDLGLLPPETLTHVPLKHVSASTIESYIKCPFIFASKKLFRLEDRPSLDLELDPLNAGSLSHKVLEKLLQQGVNKSWSDEDLDLLIEGSLNECKITLADPKIWKGLKRKYLNLSRRFIQFEKDWKIQFPLTKNLGCEVKFSGFIDPVTGRLTKEPTSLPFMGSIDRLDTDGTNNVILIDYKPSKNENLVHHPKWTVKGTLQLGLYAAALEAGLVNEKPLSVSGAVYYFLKDFKRHVGFLVEEEQGKLFETSSFNKILESDKKNLLLNVEQAAAASLQGILSGKIPATPQDPNLCENCRWNTLCRGVHLL
ncbi:MAG: PD-(D/E)XK nuclease family protein [Bdellovibrionales bacterium]